MGRTNKINVYVSDSDQSRLEREAEDAGMSLSGYCMSLIERQWKADDTEAVADQLDVEEKVEQIVADARDELVGIARSVDQRNDDVADMTARAGSYSIANFELMKDEFDPAESRKAEALLTGSRRLREPIGDHPDRNLDLNAEDAGDDDEGHEERPGYWERQRQDKKTEKIDRDYNVFDDLRPSEEEQRREKRERIRRDHEKALREYERRKAEEQRSFTSRFLGS